MKKLLTSLIVACTLHASAQVKIGDNPDSINANSLIEMESTNKGFLPPRLPLNSISSVSPLTGPVPAGMLVFSSGGTLRDGYYYWNSSEWQWLSGSNMNIVTKTISTTLAKTERFVLASNDIEITLPVISSADDGLSFIIKNNGTHTDRLTIRGSGAATIDGDTTSYLTRWVGKTFTAYNSSWVINEKTLTSDNLLLVNSKSSWTSLQEAIEYLNLHMTGPSVIRLGEEVYEINETLVIDLPYSLTLQGISYGTATLAAAPGLTNKPMFRCISDTYFKMLQFEADSLPGYGTQPGEDAIRFVGSGSYNEVKDCSFNKFYNTLIDSTDAELWVFECDIVNTRGNAILLHSALPGAIVKVAETDFIGCARGINLSKGSGATIQLSSGGYYNVNLTDTAIIYNADDFVFSESILIKGNLWNDIGVYIVGFDFTRSDGRDANDILEGNAGIGDKKPYCFINVLNSTATKTLVTQNTWYKADWGVNTASQTCKWTIEDNKITYQPANQRNGTFTIAGNLSVDNINRVISMGIVKNGNTAVTYGETTLRITTQNQPFQFSFLVFLEDIAEGDYFEIFYTSTNSGDVVKIQDIQWLVNTQ